MSKGVCWAVGDSALGDVATSRAGHEAGQEVFLYANHPGGVLGAMATVTEARICTRCGAVYVPEDSDD